MVTAIHTCAAPGCEMPLPDELAFCKPHWNEIPKKQRSKVYRTWDDAFGLRSSAYGKAVQAAADALASPRKDS